MEMASATIPQVATETVTGEITMMTGVQRDLWLWVRTATELLPIHARGPMRVALEALGVRAGEQWTFHVSPIGTVWGVQRAYLVLDR